MNCSDMRMPPSPSVIVWCIFCTRRRAAALERRRRARTPTAGGCGRTGPARSCDAEVEQLALGARRGQRDVAQVVVDVEVGVVVPLGRGEAAERGDDPLVQAGDAVDHAARRRRRRRSMSAGWSRMRDAAERRAQERVLLDVPHHRLDVGHAPVAAHLALAPGAPSARCAVSVVSGHRPCGQGIPRAPSGRRAGRRAAQRGMRGVLELVELGPAREQVDEALDDRLRARRRRRRRRS